MNQDYVDTVRLLLAVAPAVFHSPRFALKGGTALLNLHKLKSRHAARFAVQHDALAASFEKLPFAR
jgi:hypothetical protein